MATKHTYKMVIVLAALMLFAATSAQAALFRVGPNVVPSPPGNGYPLWYQDTLGVALDLCIPETAAQDAACLAPPVPDPAQPIAFPGNWPDESFWHVADATFDFDAAGTNSALLVQALEAAFGGGAAAVGDQIVFGRIRIRIDAPVDGTYTVTYPYGEQVFPEVTAGTKAINVTSDIGIGAPGDFTGALNSAIGPFLIPLADPVIIDGDTFLSNGLTAGPVTGSPFGTNFFRVCVDNPAGLGLNGLPLTNGGLRCMETADFTVIGKVHQGAIGSPLTLDRATYARSAGLAHVDVFATATSGPGAAPPVISFGDALGTNLMPSKLMNGPTVNNQTVPPTILGQYYGQSIPTDARAIPAAVIVTNVADNPPSSVTRSLVDEVTFSQASYDPADGSLTITATSSDKGDSVAPAILPPQLFVIGLPGSLTGSDELTITPIGSTDPAERQGSFTIPPFTGGPVPPFAVTVISSAGGQDAEVVTAVAGGVFRAGAPVAVDDSVSFVAGSTAPVPISVLQNDFGFNPATVVIVSQGNNGTALANPVTGVISYSFINSNLVGDDTFTYSVRSAVAPSGFVSNVATVTVTTTAPVGGPVPTANPDTASVAVGGSVLINVLANDTGNGDTLNLASVTIGTQPTRGTATPNPANGFITYTPNGTTPSTDTFTYAVSNTNGNLSNFATVTVTVTAPETLTVALAEYRQLSRRWRVSGTSTVRAGQTITITYANGTMRNAQLVNGVSTTNATGYVIRTAVVDALGNWAVDFILPSNLGIANPTNTGNNTPTGSFWTSPPRNVRVTSSFPGGANVTANLTIRN